VAGQFQLAEAFVELSSRGFAGVQSAIGGIQSRLEGMVNSARMASSRMSSMFADVAKGAASHALGNLTSAVGSQFGSFAKGFVTNNAEFEAYQTQFEVLLKSADKAKARLQELSTFADVTPFELGEVVRASKTLQTFGGDVLATGKSLTMIGDMAAASGEQFDRVAMWVGRAYTAIQAGRPWGEAAVRLQELGLMSGETRQRFEDMEKAGKSGAAVWAEFVKSMDPVSGMMDKMSKTFTGKFSTFRDGITKASRTIGEPIFKELKSALDRANDALSSSGIQDRITNIAAIIKARISQVKDVVSGVVAAAMPYVSAFVDRLGGLSSILKTLGLGALVGGAAVAATWLAGLSAGAVLLAAKLAAIGTIAAPVFNAVSGFVQENQERFRAWGTAVAEIAANTFAQLKALALSWVDTFAGMFGRARQAANTLWLYVADGISGTLAVLRRFASRWDIAWEMMKTSAAIQISRIVDVTATAWNNIASLTMGLAEGIGAVFAEVGNRVATVWKSVQNSIGRVLAGQMAYSDWIAAHPGDIKGAQQNQRDAQEEFDRMAGNLPAKRDFADVFREKFDARMNDVKPFEDSDATKILRKQLEDLAAKLENAYQNGMTPVANLFNRMGKDAGGLLAKAPAAVNGLFGGLMTLDGWLKALHAPTEGDKKKEDAKIAGKDRKAGEVLDAAEFWKRAQEAAGKQKDPVVEEVKKGNEIAVDIKKNAVDIVKALNKPFFGVFG